MKNNKTLRTLFALIAIVSLLLTASLSIIAQADTGKHFSVVEAATNADSLSISQIAAKTRTSVVAIETESKVTVSDDPFYGYGSPFGGLFGYGFGFGDGYGYGGRGRNREYTSRAAGSGVIISEDGYIVTNNHVISGADKITVYVLSEDGTETTHEATLVGASENNDIAVLKIDAMPSRPTPPSTPATPAADCSTPTATWSASSMPSPLPCRSKASAMPSPSIPSVT